MPRGASGLNFKIYGVCFDALRGGQRKFYRGSVVVAQQRGGALASYTQLWQLKGVSDADGFAAFATAAEAIKGVVSATVVMRCQWQGF